MFARGEAASGWNIPGFIRYFKKEYFIPVYFRDLPDTTIWTSSWFCGCESLLRPGHAASQNLIESFFHRLKYVLAANSGHYNAVQLLKCFHAKYKSNFEHG